MKQQTREDNYIIDYYNEIKNGNIIACEYIKKLLKKLIKEFDDPLYIVDFKEADLRINFIENCCKLTKSPYYGKPFKLMLWQKAFITSIFCFYKEIITEIKEDGTQEKKWVRRFKEALLLVARKNGKSELCSAIGLSSLICGEKASDIVVSSNDDNQSKLVYEAISSMREILDPKQKYIKRTQSQIEAKNKSKIFRMSEKMKNTEGRNIDEALIDEVNMMDSEMKIINSINQSTSIKEQSLTIYLTSEGFVDNGALDILKNRAVKMLNEETEDDRYLPWMFIQEENESKIFKAVDEGNYKLFEKSNPTIGQVKKINYLFEQLEGSKDDKIKRIWVLNKDLNIKQSGAANSFLENQYYNYEQESFNIQDFKNFVCVASVDLAEVYDLTALTLLFFKRDKQTGEINKNIFTHQMYFIPENKLKSTDNFNYKEAVEKGQVRIAGDFNVDGQVVADYLYELYTLYGIMPLYTGYDIKFANSFLAKMKEIGFDTEMVQQNAMTLNNSIRYTEQLFRNKRVQFNNNDILKWCISNSCLQLDNRQQVLLVKRNNNPAFRIDGIVSFVIGIEIFLRHKQEIEKYIKY